MKNSIRLISILLSLVLSNGAAFAMLDKGEHFLMDINVDNAVNDNDTFIEIYRKLPDTMRESSRTEKIYRHVGKFDQKSTFLRIKVKDDDRIYVSTRKYIYKRKIHPFTPREFNLVLDANSASNPEFKITLKKNN